MRNSVAAAFDLAEYAAGTDDSLPLRPASSPVRRYTPPLEATPDVVTRASPSASPPPRPLINGPAHFTDSDATKNDALLNRDETNLRLDMFPPSSCFFLALFPVIA